MCLVDYRGFRLVAMSLLPISKSTLIYGSDDAGKTVHNDDPEFSNLMKEAASIINLKGHVTDAKGTTIYGPTDIEGNFLSVRQVHVLFCLVSYFTLLLFSTSLCTPYLSVFSLFRSFLIYS